MSNAKIPMTFQIYQGADLVRTETLTQDIIKVGKLPSSHLRIEDEKVSRMHAVIEIGSANEIFIIDLGSAAGTIVNGKKVNRAQLQGGDEIVLGDTRVVVEIGGAAADDTVVGASEAIQAAPEPMRPAAPAAPAKPALANPFAAGAALPNPFAPAPVARAASKKPTGPIDPEKVRYGIAASTGPVNPTEVEIGDSATEVVVMWGDLSVLHVAHLSPPRNFYIGEGSTDYLMSSDVLGASKLPVVVAAGGGAAAVIPDGAEGDVTIGDQTHSIEDLRAQGKLQPCPELAGAQQFVLPTGAVAKVKYRGLTFVTKQTSAGKPVGVGGAPDIAWHYYVWTIVSLGIHAAFLLMFYFMPPPGSALNLSLLNEDSRLIQYLTEPPETQEEETPDWVEEQEQNDDEGGKGKRHRDEEGAMGEESSKKTRNRFGIQGPADNTDPQMARDQAREQAANAGAIGVLRAMTGSWNSPTSPYGADQALGNDPMSAMGALMGDQIGSNFGIGGLGLRGTGRGGGGTGEGTIGLGNLGTIGHGGGGGSGSGYGRGAGNLGGRSARVPQIRTGTADVRGSLSAEVIRRVIRRHINEVRFCYEQQLNQRPDLEGRVVVSFIISPTGAVQSAAVRETTLNNGAAEGCITQAVRRWTFPSPDGGGIVGVNYPFVLSATGG